MINNGQNNIEISELATNSWWLQQIQNNQNWIPGGVYSVFLGPTRCIAPVAAWFTTAAQLKITDGTYFFKKVLVVSPPGLRSFDYKSNFIATVKCAFKDSDGVIPEVIRQQLSDTTTILEESNAESILNKLDMLPEGSAVGICAAHRLRFNGLTFVNEAGIKTHTGFTVRNVKGEDLTLPHLFELFRRLLNIASTKNLSIVVFVEQFSMELKNLPEDIRSHAGLALCSTHDDPTLKDRYLARIKSHDIRREHGADAAIHYLRENILQPDHQLVAVSDILGADGRWLEAWNLLKPCFDRLLTIGDVSLLLNLSIAAAACGEADDALTALVAALNVGFDTVEQFNAAALVAKNIKAMDAQASLLQGMIKSFPDHPMTLACSYEYLMRTQQYTEAATMARKNGHKYDEAWAMLNAQPEPDWQTFFAVAKDTQMEIDALEKAFYFQLDCGEITKAEEYFAQIIPDKTNSPIRAMALLELIVKRIQFAKEDNDLNAIQNDWSEVLRYIAINPTDTSLRFRLNHVLETAIDDRTRHLIVVFNCINAFKKAENMFDLNNVSKEAFPIDFEVEGDIDAETVGFIREVENTNPARPLGRGVIPVTYQNGVSNRVMAGLTSVVHAFTRKPDYGGICVALQCVSIACHSRNESTWDFQVAVQLLSALVNDGKVSDALNLAEQILYFWHETPAEYSAARRAHSWSCMAEVYHRARNPLTALLHLNICFEAMLANPIPQHVSMLKQKLRLGARIFRDLRFNQYARTFIARELALVEAFPERKREHKEVLATDISCRLHDLNAGTPLTEIAEVFNIARLLLEDLDEREWGPPVSLGLSLLNLCRSYGFKSPDGFNELVLSRTLKCPLPMRQLFRRFLLEHPTVDDITAQMRDLVEGNVNDDQGYQFDMVDGLLRRAIKTSCERNDAELFLLAATWLSQPALAASRATWEVDSGQPEAPLAKITELFPTGVEPNTARARDYAKAMAGQINQAVSNFVNLVPLPLSALGFVAATNEALCFLVHDSDKRLCRLVVRRDGIDGPTQISNTEWNHDHFIAWQKKYPEDYSWDKKYATYGPYEIPDLDVVRSSLANLQPMIPVGSQNVTVLPEADLFGFTFFLNENNGRWVGELTQCVTAPSLPWLATVRQSTQKALFSLKGWLGHPTLADNAVLIPRGELKPIIAKHKGEIIVGETPKLLRQSEIAVILSHGSRGLFRSFAGVNDVGKFSNEDLVHCLGKSKCVIFFVCNAGRNDARLFNNETFGLVGRLLQRDVRTVIAPPAPLSITLPAVWLDPFLESLRGGDPVGTAHAKACAVIRAQFSHPCAWGALQLFGDANLCFQSVT